MDLLNSPYSYKNEFIKSLYSIIRDERSIPSVSYFTKLLNISFWATLKTEEGIPAKVSLTLTSCERLPEYLKFENPITLSAENLRKLSPLVSKQNVCLIVSPLKNNPVIYGICSIFEKLTIRSKSFGHICVYENEELLMDFQPGKVPLLGLPYILLPQLQLRLFLKNKSCSEDKRIFLSKHLSYLANTMTHGCGGNILVVSEDDNNCRESLAIKYQINKDKLSYLSDYDYWMQQSKEECDEFKKEIDPKNEGLYYKSLNSPSAFKFKQTANLIGMLTAVDGATVIDENLSIIGFGAKIKQKNEDLPDEIFMHDPYKHETVLDGEYVKLKQLGGMRHRSAIYFVNDNPNSLSLVCSQDGSLTLFMNDDFQIKGFKCDTINKIRFEPS